MTDTVRRLPLAAALGAALLGAAPATQKPTVVEYLLPRAGTQRLERIDLR